VDDSIVEAIRAIPAITDARLIRLHEAAKPISPAS
jgi:hypothetical protein